METANCPYCQGEIQPEAIKCRHCKADLVTIHFTPANDRHRSVALPLVSFLLSVYTLLASLDYDELDKDAAAGMLVFALAALLTGVISLARGMGFKPLAAVSVVISVIIFFVMLGILAEF